MAVGSDAEIQAYIGDGTEVVELYFVFSSTCPHCQAALPHIVEDVKWGNDLVFSIDGGKIDLADWRGKPVLVVNTASTGQHPTQASHPRAHLSKSM